MSSYTSTPRYQHCQRLFDRVYPDFRNAGQRYEDHIHLVISPTTHLLDVGCGRTSLAANTIAQTPHTVGIDLKHHDLLHNTLVHTTAVANADHLPFPDTSFDLVISQWVVEHFQNPQHAFTEIARVLKPNGHFIFLTTNARNYIPVASNLIPDRLRHFILEKLLRRPAHESFPTFYRANTAHALARLASQVGLTVENLEYVGNPFYLAFNPLLFRLALWFEKFTDHPRRQRLKLYIVATFMKQS